MRTGQQGLDSHVCGGAGGWGFVRCDALLPSPQGLPARPFSTHTSPLRRSHPLTRSKRALMHRFRERYQREMTGGAAAANGEDGGEGTSPEELAARGGAGGRDPWSNPLATELQLLEDCGEGHLGEPLFADNLTAFAVLEVSKRVRVLWYCGVCWLGHRSYNPAPRLPPPPTFPSSLLLALYHRKPTYPPRPPSSWDLFRWARAHYLPTSPPAHHFLPTSPPPAPHLPTSPHAAGLDGLAGARRRRPRRRRPGAGARVRAGRRAGLADCGAVRGAGGPGGQQAHRRHHARSGEDLGGELHS